MKDKLQNKIEKIKDEFAEEALNAHLTQHDQKQSAEALFLLGGIRAAQRIADSLSANTMRALIQFQKDDRYKPLGHDNFVDFLENSEYSPMSKSQFYERKKILEIEGDAVFDLLNSIEMPVSTRKMLGKGNVQIDGDTVIIKNNDDSETTIELSDRARILETLTTLADRSTEQSKRLTKGKEDYDRLKQRLVEVEDAPRSINHSQSPIEKFNSLALGGLSALADELENATIVDAGAFADGSLKLLAAQYNRVNQILCDKLAIDDADWKQAMSEITATRRELFSETDDKIASLLDDDED